METWDLVLPPSRPSREQLVWFRYHLQQIPRDCAVAILGSTPELRDLVADLEFQDVFVIERNRQFYRRMNSLRVRSSPEHLLDGDWLEILPSLPGKFGAILSDLTSGNIRYQDRRRYYEAIAVALRPRGVFCDKYLSHPVPHTPLAELLPRYDVEPLNLATVNHFNCEVFFCSELLEESERVDTSRFYSQLRGLRLSPRVLAILERLPQITPPGMHWDYGRPWEQLKEDFRPMLQCVDDIVEGDGPYARRLRLMKWARS